MNKADCEQGLRALLQKYHVDAPAKLELTQKDGLYTLIAGSASVPLMPWRHDRRFQEMHALKNSGRAGLCCVLRSGRIVPRSYLLRSEILRELDICEWLVDDSVQKVYAAVNGSAANIVCTLSDGLVATLEVSAALEEGQSILDRHEINTRRGVISDRVVDTQVPQSSVYLFSGGEPETYTDVDFELNGLDAAQVGVVRDAFSVLKDQSGPQYVLRREYLVKLVQTVYRSAEQNRCLSL